MPPIPHKALESQGANQQSEAIIEDHAHQMGRNTTGFGPLGPCCVTDDAELTLDELAVLRQVCDPRGAGIWLGD